jgi:hypothetical protein
MPPMVVMVAILGMTWNRPGNRRHGEGSPPPRLVKRPLAVVVLSAVHGCRRSTSSRLD